MARPRVLDLARPPRLVMAPMIDIVFLLLIFFMFTHLTVVAGQLDARLPASPGLFPAGESRPEVFSRTIHIECRRRAGFEEVRVNGEFSPDLEALYRRLLFIRSDVVRPIVLIDAEDAASVGLVVGVFDTCRRAGFADINFTPPTEEVPGR